ncbi:hypothetical protein BDD21_1189 [Thiocapsa rosea]|uniref:Uncharacterized protein n=2 Tax=Thiocapsa rosea TaxID=69360 RepID=A0A495V3E0_9GAMM|nr:hypothetical protein BDD21_1189 [Thiocapsa rosea]
MICRIAHFEFDIASTAGWYSSIAGLLTGFALLAILLPLDHEAKREDVECTNAVVVFVCAFFSLLVLSINYAVLAGRTAGGTVAAVAAHEQMLFGPAFGLSALLLLFGLNAVLRTYGANREIFLPAQHVILLMTSLLGPILVLSLQFSNALDLEFFRVQNDPDAARCSVAGLPDTIWINLAITGVAVAAVLALAALGHRLRIPRHAPILIAKIVLGFTVATTAWTAVVAPMLPVEPVTGLLFEQITLTLTAIATVAAAAAAHAGQ